MKRLIAWGVVAAFLIWGGIILLPKHVYQQEFQARQAAKTPAGSGCRWNSNGTTELPDKHCTPGEINPALTKEVICSKTFRTGDYRDKTTTAQQKHSVYPAYSIPPPQDNIGANQKCELDHLVSLENGGSDGLKNIWPQCTEGYESWQGLGFREKDKVENRVHQEICAGEITLEAGQQCLATDWTKCK